MTQIGKRKPCYFIRHLMHSFKVRNREEFIEVLLFCGTMVCLLGLVVLCLPRD